MKMGCDHCTCEGWMLIGRSQRLGYRF